MKVVALLVVAAAVAGCGKKKETPGGTSGMHEPIVVTPDDVVRMSAAAETGPSLLISSGGVWLGAAAEDATFVPRCAVGIDAARLEAELCRLSAAHSTSFIELASRDGLAYGDIVLAMDVAAASGFGDVTFVDEASLSIEFPVDPPAPASAPPCSDPVPCIVPSAAPVPQPETTAAPRISQDLGIRIDLRDLPDGRDPSKSAAVLVVFHDGSMKLGGVPVSRDDLYDRLRAHQPAGDLLILQADERARSEVVGAVIKTAYAAGRPNVLFAVNRR